MKSDLKLTTFIAVFGVSVSCIYLHVYWTAFDVNVFEFAGASDFAKLAISPLLITGGSWMAGTLFGVVSPRPAESMSRAFEVVARSGWVARNGNRIRMLCALSAVIAYVLTPQYPLLWLLLVFLLFPVTFIAVDSEYLKNVFPSLYARHIAVGFFIMLPVMAGAFAALNAEAVKRGVAKKIVVRTGIAANVSAQDGKPVMYVGFLSGTYVLYETSTRRVVIVKQSDSEPIVFEPNPYLDVPWYQRLREASPPAP